MARNETSMENFFLDGFPYATNFTLSQSLFTEFIRSANHVATCKYCMPDACSDLPSDVLVTVFYLYCTAHTANIMLLDFCDSFYKDLQNPSNYI